MICQTFLVGNGKLNNGWVHAEAVLPFSVTNLRPSWTVRRTHHERLVASFVDIFEKMWNESEPPNAVILRRYGAEE